LLRLGNRAPHYHASDMNAEIDWPAYVSRGAGDPLGPARGLGNRRLIDARTDQRFAGMVS